jgi:hypothetical protein
MTQCAFRKVNSFDYLKDLFTHFPAAKITRIKEFVPATWTKAKRRKNYPPWQLE